MRLRDRYTGTQLEGDWVPLDDFGGDVECPECGAEPGSQCSAPDPDDPEGFRGVEVSNYIHRARDEVVRTPTALAS